VTKRMVYRIFFLGLNFLSGLTCILKSKKNLKNLKNLKKLFPKYLVFSALSTLDVTLGIARRALN